MGVTAANAWWIIEDAAPQPHPNDPYIYLSKALQLADALSSGEPEGLKTALTQLSFGGRPPLYQLVTVPSLLAFGRSLDAALMVNLGFVAILLVCVYAIGSVVAGSRAGLLAAVITAAYPPILQLSRIYRPHGAIPAITALSLLLLLLLLRDRSVRIAWAFGASLAAGVLLHPTFVYAVAAPTLVFGVYLALFQSPPHRPPTPGEALDWLVGKLVDPFVVRGLLPAALLVVSVAWLWYGTTGATLLDTAEQFSELPWAVRLGFFEIAPTFWWYARTAPSALSNVLACLALAGIIACAMRNSTLHRVLAVTAVCGYAIESVTWMRVWWYFVPILPVAAAATGVWISEVEHRWLRRCLTAAALGASAICFSLTMFDAGPRHRAIAEALGAPIDSIACHGRETAFCATPPQPQRWPVQEIVGAVVNDAANSGRGDQTHTVFLAIRSTLVDGQGEWPPMMSVLFDYHRLRDWPDSRIEFLDSREIANRPHFAACKAHLLWSSDYLVHFVSRLAASNYCMAFWTHLLANPPPRFLESHALLASFALPGNREAQLWKRTEPATILDRLDAIDSWRKFARIAMKVAPRSLGRSPSPIQRGRLPGDESTPGKMFHLESESR